jgi:asparagine synthase (glutamine-hydrolysing)
MSSGAIAGTGLFNPQSVEKLAAKCMQQGATGFRDNAAFVGILSTQLWHQQFSNRSLTAQAA